MCFLRASTNAILFIKIKKCRSYCVSFYGIYGVHTLIKKNEFRLMEINLKGATRIRANQVNHRTLDPSSGCM